MLCLVAAVCVRVYCFSVVLGCAFFLQVLVHAGKGVMVVGDCCLWMFWLWNECRVVWYAWDCEDLSCFPSCVGMFLAVWLCWGKTGYQT